MMSTHTIAGDNNLVISGNFLVDEARTQAALQNLSELAERTALLLPTEKDQSGILADPAMKETYVRCMAMLDAARQSDYFKSIKDKVHAGQYVTAAEYYYFAMTTDNVNTLNTAMLRAMMQEQSKLAFEDNCQVLIALRDWQEADNTTKNSKSAIFRNVCKERGRFLLASCKQFLNLHGVNLAAADLTATPFDCADLGGALFIKTIVYDASFNLSCVAGANFSEATCKIGQAGEGKGASFKLADATRVNFDSFHAADTSFYGADLTGSSFKGAAINGDFNHAILNLVNFTGTKLGFSWPQIKTEGCSVVGAILHDAILENINFEQVDFTQAEFIVKEIMTDIVALAKAIEDMTLNAVNHFQQSQMSVADMNAYLNTLHTIVVKSVIHAINELSDDVLLLTEKMDLLDALQMLPVLNAGHDLEDVAGRVTKCCTTFFARVVPALQAVAPVVQLIQNTIEDLNQANMKRYPDAQRAMRKQ